MYNLSGKVAVITGAGSGIGRELAINLAMEGCLIAICDIDAAALEKTHDRVTHTHAKVMSQVVDVSNRKAVYEWAEAVVQHFGKVNIVINNAGVALTDTIENMSYTDFSWLMNINFWGVVYSTKAFLPALKQQTEAHIVNLSSIFGIISVPTQAAYNAAKFAVRGFTEALRQELAHTSVGVTCVHPGGIRTNIVRHARLRTDMNGHSDPNQQLLVDQFERMAQTSPHEAAISIINAIKQKQKRLLIGRDAKFLDCLQRLFPSRYERVLKYLRKVQLKKLNSSKLITSSEK